MAHERAGRIAGLLFLLAGISPVALAGPVGSTTFGLAGGTETWAALSAESTILPDPVAFLQRTHQPWVPGLRVRVEAGLASGLASLGLVAARWDIHGGGTGDVELNSRVVQRWWLAGSAPLTCFGGEVGLTVIFVRIAGGAIRCPRSPSGHEWLPTLSATLKLLAFDWH